MNKLRHVSIIVLPLIVLSIALAIILLLREKEVLAPASGFDEPTIQVNDEVSVAFKTEAVLEGLTKPWGIDFLPDGTLFFTERAGAINIFKDGVKTELLVPDNLDARGEGGLLGVAVDPNYETTSYVYVCYNTTNDVRVVRWQLTNNVLSDETVIVSDIPTATSGRHSGCRPAFGPDGYLWVATGDSAQGGTPQDPASLGGKILRVDRDGIAASGNLELPFDARVYSYGHRNIQGIAFKQDSSFIGVSAEHGPNIDDEINILLSGNFGWNPVPGYNETVPMTDLQKYPDAISAVWSSGDPTVALSGATFISGSEWGQLEGQLLVATLKAKRVLQFAVDESGNLTPQAELFNDEFGRIRSIEQAPDGALYMTTDNGNGTDIIVKVTPQ